MINSEPLPWSEWAAEFREKLPNEISALIKEFSAGTSAEDHSKSIRERLKLILDLYKVSRYRPSTNGTLMIDMDRIVQGAVPRTREYNTASGTGHGSGPKGTPAGGAYSAYLKKDGVPGKEVSPDIFPEVMWVSVKDGSRTAPYLEDRAAKYLPETNQLIINADFRVFKDMIDKWNRDLGQSAAVNDAVTEAVTNWFQMTLVETVIGIQALQKSLEWTDDDIKKAVSEESLTAAVMPRYHVYNSVKRQLGSKLGKIQIA